MDTSWMARPAVQRKEVDLRLVPLGFLALIALGTLLLALPWSHRTGHEVAWLDALFLSTSATCVTGLTTVNVGVTFNGFGQAVLLLLIQAGGLGIFTASLSLVLLSGNRLSLADEQSVHATVGKLKGARPADVFIYACLFVFVIELAGTVALFSNLEPAGPDTSPWQSLWEAAFHSVSAFCNAGISLYPEGLVRWRGQPAALGITCGLVILGGIGLMTLINVRYLYFWRRDPRLRGRLTLQTKVSLVSAAALLLAGTAVTLWFDYDHTLADSAGWDRIGLAFFHSAMTRTAGFNVVDIGAMNPPTLLASAGLMFIGGAPGSMAGGIKTTTFVILLATAWSTLRRREEIQFWRRQIRPRTAHTATMLTLLAGTCVMLGVGTLMWFENGHPSAAAAGNWLGLVFEAMSAFGTVGLSTGATPLLTAPGKLVILTLMFIGRIGPLMLSVYLARPTNPRPVRHPNEDLALG